MRLNKIKLCVVLLLVVGLLVLAGCGSSNSQYDRYQTQQAGGAPAAVGGGCGVTAPSDGASNPLAVVEDTDSAL